MTDDDGCDAFGQPLTGDASTGAVPAASPSPRPSRTPSDPAVDPVPRRPRRSPLPVLFTIATVAVTGVVLYETDQKAADSAPVVSRELDGHAVAVRSVVRAANFRRALDAVRGEMEPGEQLLSLRLTPHELSTTVRDGNGNTRLVDVGIDFSVDARDWSTDTSSTPLDLAAIDPAVPEKVIRATLRQAGTDDTHFDYLSLSGGNPPAWYIALDDVPIGQQAWSADLAGVAVTHPGELPPAQGLTGPSLLREENLTRALGQVAQYGKRVTSLRLAPDRLDVHVRGRGTPRDVQVDAAQRAIVRDSPGASAVSGVRLDRIDPAAPGRAFAAAAQAGGIPPAKMDYAVLTTDGWTLFFKDVPQRKQAWHASRDGRQVERLG